MIKYIVSKLFTIFNYVNKVIPKEKGRILFYNRTETYMNNYALFKYMEKNEKVKSRTVIYAMPNVNVFIINQDCKTVNLKGIISYVKTIFNFMRSEYVFYDNSNLRINPSKKQKVINLWHGTPLKKIGFMSKSATKLTKNALNCFDKILLSNECQDEIYKKSFNLQKNQILHMGYPRNDLLFTEEVLLSKVISNYSKFSKHIIWMTTYRVTKEGISHTDIKNWSETGIPLINNERALKTINDFLLKENIQLIIKMHNNNSEDRLSKIEYSNIFYLSEDMFLKHNLQMYELLGSTDALITDYSSIYFDYLLLNKPIGFILDDIESYKSKNGLYYDDIDEYLPGMHIYNLNELEIFFKNIVDNNDVYKGKRVKVNSIFNKYDCKGYNCEQLLTWLSKNKK